MHPPRSPTTRPAATSAWTAVVQRLAPAASLVAAARALATAIEHLPANTCLTRFEVDVPPTDLLAWLAERPARLRFALVAAEAGIAATGGVIAYDGDHWHALAELEQQLGTEPRLWFTARFDLTRTPAAEWAEFGRVRAVLPALELRRDGAQCTLACTVGGVAAPRAEVLDLLRGMNDPGPSAPPPIVKPAGGDHQSAWQHAVDGVLADLARHQLRKAVLARRACWAATGTLCPVRLASALARAHPETRIYCVQPDTDAAFVGASPELLLQRAGTHLTTEALAGTRGRGATLEVDARLAESLLHSAKDRLEQRLVLDYLVERLTPLCDRLDADPLPGLRRLRHAQHLRTEVQGRLRTGIQTARVLASLHPTPAVCGLPTEQARAAIAAAEPFDRGLFAGVVGWLTADQALAIVAIRSALVRAATITAYAGAGIVSGSEAAGEWAETATKLDALASVLEHAP